MHLVSRSKFPPPSSGIHFRVPKFPPASLSIFFACILMYLHFVSMSGLHPLISQQLFALILFQYRAFPFPYVPVNFLHPSPIGLSTTSYVFIVSIPELPRHQQLLACILSQYLNSPHPVPGQKNVHGIQPNVSAYNNGIFPPTHGSKKQETELRNT